jgi:hypothetical protein
MERFIHAVIDICGEVFILLITIEFCARKSGAFLNGILIPLLTALTTEDKN